MLFGVVAAGVLLLAFTAAAGAAPSNNTAPTITGVFASGQTLTANTSASDWTYSGSLSFGYQWYDCTSYAGTVNAENPVGYWRLGESSTSSNAADASGNASDGNYNGGVSLNEAGAITDDPDTAATFDGSSGYVEVPNASALNPTKSFTLEAWVNTSSKGGTVIAKPFTVGDKQSYSLGIDSSGDAYATVVTTSNTYTATSTAKPVSDGQWHQLDATWASSVLKIYVDGTAASKSTAGTLQYSSLPLEIGRWDGTKGDYFNGTLDEVAVFGSSSDTSGALSASQISTNHSVATSGCSAISGATNQTYTLVDGDVGKNVMVTVTATDSTGSTSANSASHLVSPAGSGGGATAPANTTAPDISGTPAVGGTLTASNG